MTRRTKQIDDSREVVLPFKVKGKQAFTKAGQLSLSGDEKHQLADNIAAQKLDSEAHMIFAHILQNAADFFLKVFQDVAPVDVQRALQDAQFDRDIAAMSKFTAWINETGFHAVQDGLTTVVKAGGKVLATMTAPVPEIYRQPVLEMLAKWKAEGPGGEAGPSVSVEGSP